MQNRINRLLLLIAASILFAVNAYAGEPEWVPAMRQVHAKNKGEKGIFLQVGDSLTYSMAFFAPLQHSRKAKMFMTTRDALNLVNRHMNKDCYSWKGPEKGNFSGKTASWGLDNIDRWITELRPETAVIMFGSNEILQNNIKHHEKNLRALVQKCLEHGVVVILNTIPPMHGHEEQIKKVVEMQRRVAAEMKVPLIDFYAHVINRRPDDWNGALPQFANFGRGETPTLIGSDGIHLSYPKQWQQDYTEEGLSHNGYVLRTWLTLMAYAEVINVVMNNEPPSAISTTILGANPLNQ